MSPQGADALTAAESGIGVPRGAKINPDIVGAELVAVHIYLVDKEEEVAVRGLVQLLVAASSSGACQAFCRSRIIYFIANLNLHGRSAFWQNASIMVYRRFQCSSFLLLFGQILNRGRYGWGGPKKYGGSVMAN